MIENVLRLLVDNRSEVRQKAGEMMSGMFHYRIVEDPSELIVSYPVSGMFCTKLFDIYASLACAAGKVQDFQFSPFRREEE